MSVELVAMIAMFVLYQKTHPVARFEGHLRKAYAAVSAGAVLSVVSRNERSPASSWRGRSGLDVGMLRAEVIVRRMRRMRLRGELTGCIVIKGEIVVLQEVLSLCRGVNDIW